MFHNEEKMKPEISIVVPVYQVEKFVRDSIQSILNQTYISFEIICINDGSRDSSLNILQQLAQEDSRVKVFSQENQGVSAARNTALDMVSGEYVAFLDPDDIMHPQFLEIMLSEIKANDADVVCCGFKKISENEKVINPPVYESVRSKKFKNHLLSFALRKKPRPNNSLWNKIYKSSVIKSIRFEKDIKVAEDMLFILRTLINAEKVFYIKTPLIYYRIRENSITHFKLTEAYIDSHILAAKTGLQLITSNSVSDKDRKKLMIFLQKIIFKSCVVLPYQKLSIDDRMIYWEKYQNVLTSLLKTNVYQPQCLDLYRRFCSFLFIKHKFRLLNFVLKKC